jgi:hypothetical protein
MVRMTLRSSRPPMTTPMAATALKPLTVFENGIIRNAAARRKRIANEVATNTSLID